jgi:hypothetical protein
VTPPGKPLALTATLPVNPPVRAIVIVPEPLAPRLTVKLVGLAESEKSGALTTSPIEVMRDNPPPVPVTVIVADPVVALADAVSVRVELAPVVDDGLKLAVTPPGNPLALNATLLLKPLRRVMFIVLVPLAPRLIVTLDGLAASEKSAAPEPGSPQMIPLPLVLTKTRPKTRWSPVMALLVVPH